MSIAATSLKLPKRLKSRIDRLARQADESAHAFMLRALEAQVQAAELHHAFVEDGRREDEAMQRTGMGYEADAVHGYLAAKARGAKPRRPKAVRWRG